MSPTVVVGRGFGAGCPDHDHEWLTDRSADDDGRDPALFVWPNFEIEYRLQAAVGAIQRGE